MIEKELAEKLMKLFVNRNDVYAEAYIGEDKSRMAYAKKEKPITEKLILEHIKGKKTIGVYQLKENKVKWACLDFDLNTPEDYDNAQKLFIKLKQKGLNPLIEKSGGGDYKIHIWIFCDCEAKDIKYFLEDICEEIKVMPHEIFPKQTEAKKEDYGNLVKLPLGLHLVTERRSVFLDDNLNEIITLEGINEILDFHLSHIDKIPKVIIKEKIITQFKTEDKKPSEFDSFFNFVLNNELPAGQSAEKKIYEKITGVNDNILKNQAIWFYQKGYTLEDLKNKIKPIYETRAWAFGDLKGWFKKAQAGHIKDINAGEIAEYLIQAGRKDLLELLPKEELNYKKIKLADLNASLVNGLVEVDCQITGEQIQKAIPSDIEVYCETCGKLKKYNSLNNPELFISDKEMKSILQELKDRFACDCAFKEEQTPYKTVTVKKYIDFAVLFVRDLLDRESLTAVKRYEAKKVYVINQTLPNAKTVNLKGKVFIEPKTKNLSIVCNSITPLKNQAESFQVTEEFKENSRKYFNSQKGEIKLYEQINPDIVGKARELAKQSIILQLHSPCRIPDIERKQQIRGGLNILFFGDTKLGKSKIAEDVTNIGSIPVGEYTNCETGKRTGLLYTIDNDRNALIWGSLPLNDMGLIVLDGLQSMHSEELGEFRETIEKQILNVKRSISGEALARTRIIACFNPNKPMNNYIYKCQAITDSYVFSKTPDITRWDLAIPFCPKDVSSKEIAHRKSGEKPIPADIFLNHIYWVWSRKPEHIIYTDSSTKKINDYSEELMETYTMEVLPLVHYGVRDIVTRLSVAMACQMHSTDETHEKVIVETEHVEKAVSWYKEALEMLELAQFKQDTEGKSQLTDNDCIAISKDLGKTEWDILEAIKYEPKSSTQLASMFEVSDRTIKEHYILLKKHELIDTKTKQGISLSVRGVKFVRWGMLSNGEIGKKNFTIKDIGEEKLPYCTNKKRDIDKWSIDKNQPEETEK